MKKLPNTKKGFTLVEVLVSVAILVVFLPFAASMLTNSRILASYSKHKIQAAYAAQQIIETQRQLPFAQIVSQPLQNVVLDTKGNYTNVNCNTNPNLFCGTALITVSQEAYTNTAGAKGPASPNIDHVVVTISWKEQQLNKLVPMTETYAEDIINDPMLN